MIIIFDNNRGDLFIINLFSLTTLIAPIVLYWLLTHSVSRGILRWRKVVRPSDSSPSVIRPQLLRPPPSRHMSVEMIFTIIILSTRFNYLCHNLIVDCNVRILGTVYTKELNFLRKIGEAPALRILYLRTLIPTRGVKLWVVPRIKTNFPYLRFWDTHIMDNIQI